MLLDILRERTVDPNRLAMAIDANIERMDCVNLATLLFHTGLCVRLLFVFPLCVLVCACVCMCLTVLLVVLDAASGSCYQEDFSHL